VGASFASRAAVESIGRKVGGELAVWAKIVGWSRGRPAEQARSGFLQGTGFFDTAQPHTDPVRIDHLPSNQGSLGGRHVPAGGKGDGGRRAAAPSNLSVRAATVLRIAESGARPNGFPVAARDGCPAGIALVGVSGLGVGLSDGDILVRAAGMPALDPGAVISAIVASRGARVPVISGEICRDGALFSLVVEQPYLSSDIPALQANSAYDERCLDPTRGPCDAGSRVGPGG
jgi:hypothetical protein